MKTKFLTLLLIVVMLVGTFATISYGAEKKTGLYKVDGKWQYFENGEFKAVSGLVKRLDTGTWHYVEDGVYRKTTGLVKCVQPGVSNGKWFYVERGDLTDVTGLVKSVQKDEPNNWYYVVNGKKSSETGLVKCVQGKSSGNWYYVENGKRSNKNGLVQCIYTGTSNGKWYYVENGKLKEKTGLVQCIHDGTEASTIEGITKKNWYFVEEGKLKQKTGLVKCVQPGDSQGNYYYVSNGEQDKTKTGFVKCIQPGVSLGKEYYIKSGKLTYTTGVVTVDSNKYYVKNGKPTTYTGILEVGGKYYYAQNGAVGVNHTEAIKQGGIQYVVTKGKVTMVATEADRVLFRATEILTGITNDSMTDAEKLKIAFDYVSRSVRFIRPRTPHYKGMDWPIVYANDVLVGTGPSRTGTKCGNCFSYSAVFAYMAKAIGYTEVYACHGGAHGFAEVDGLVYDPVGIFDDWSLRYKTYSRDDYYAIPYSPQKVDYNYKNAISAGYAWMRIKI